ncbi:histidinol dehydrogenase [Psychrobium sp. 1_MG-2023]|uniref:histidinol dehydrogenase n=1 Tax=Psychrobium sp. 1_MG-2023 TaxID=3062624 RepID=UPI000C338817|nr:histidinol dehydrogenase [Psychrobium sp. 1_MG-2023]MDP2560553.1 histidinol dehydrogenase [Psychrobium sp. 1_MG-2023]PKF57543.1 histidinol dehydrogenase [Alteromonadales bacterium alter-6D02]
MRTLTWSQLTTEQQQLQLQRPALENSAMLQQQVANIIDNVKQNGDAALKEYATRFDNISLEHIAVSPEAIDAAQANVSAELKAALAMAKTNIETFHRAQLSQDIVVETTPGVQCELRTQALQSVGLYTPGGSAPLPSTVLMTAIPAMIAGCPQIVLCSPPPISDVILYTAKLCGVSKIYQIGGAQAVAAMAYGSESVPKVDKIFGPGNRFVTEAKKQVAMAIGGASIDMPAGPSEVLVIADEQANPAFVAADLLSQAEHGTDSQAILLTPCSEVAKQVSIEVENQLNKLTRQEIARQAIEHSRIFVTDDLNQAIAISNLYAPEHLIIQTEQPRTVLDAIYAAGSVFLGRWSPESAGDYASGTNHVLPTYGMCNSYSSLSLADFSRRFTVQELTFSGLSTLANSICPMATAEGLDAHRNAVTIRLDQGEHNEQ